MEAKTSDPTKFRDAQRNQWNQAATGWRKWVDEMTATTQPVSDRLVELAGIDPGSRVLDVAAGYGEPALTAARKAGPEGHVVATDISAEMLAFGRERAAAAGAENLDFVESEASALDFPEGSFDAAVSRWGIIFEPEAEATAARIRSFLKPGGRMAIASWGAPPEAPMISLPMMAVLGYLQQPPPPPGTPGPLSRPTRSARSSRAAASRPSRSRRYRSKWIGARPRNSRRLSRTSWPRSSPCSSSIRPTSARRPGTR